jgi:hypothetical protein
MIKDGKGKAKLTPTGKIGAALDVTYDMTHIPANGASNNGASGKTIAHIHSITCDSGEPLPIGDCDLLVGNEILRLRHNPGDPEWLVLSLDT